VNGGVGGVGELGGENRAGSLSDDLLGPLHGAAHALGGFGQDELGAEGAQKRTPFPRHGRRHGQDDLVAARGAHPGQSDAGVAGGGLDDRSAGGQPAGGHRGVDDRDGYAVLDGIGGVVEFELGQHDGLRSLG
jgi:transcriptional regulator